MSKNLENKVNYKEHQPLKLLKNRSYPTYQLYATVSNKLDPEKAMVIAVLETMSWLRKRFRDLEIPNLHLKVGNDSKNLLRIYLFYDTERKLIVVGSLPKHLRTVTEKGQ